MIDFEIIENFNVCPKSKFEILHFFYLKNQEEGIEDTIQLLSEYNLYKGNVTEALNCLLKGLILNEKLSSLYQILIGDIYYLNLGNYKKAIKYYLLGIGNGYYNTNVYLNLGQSYEFIGDITNAKLYFDLSLKVDNTNSKTYWNLIPLAENIDEVIKLSVDSLKYETSKEHKNKMEVYQKCFLSIKYDNVNLISDENNGVARSYKWFFQLGYKPLIFYSKWKLYDYLFTITDHKKPFYEYGVSFGYSFEYLLNNYIWLWF